MRAGFALAFVAALGLLSSLQAVGQTGKEGERRQVGNGGRQPDLQHRRDGTVDWYTFSGFRRYHSECHTCHGPDGEGSTYAPGLIQSLKTMNFPEFMLIVATGREVVRADKQSIDAGARQQSPT